MLVVEICSEEVVAVATIKFLAARIEENPLPYTIPWLLRTYYFRPITHVHLCCLAISLFSTVVAVVGILLE